MFVTVVAQNKNFFTSCEVKGAEQAHRLQQQIGWPSVGHFRQIIAKNQIRNSNTTVAGIDRAQFIFGTPTPLLQGKMTRAPPKNTKISRVSIPPAC